MIAAIVLAAGRSTRMGQPKMLMPWGDTTVLGKVIQTLTDTGVEDITLVVNSTIADKVNARVSRIAINDTDEMLTSLQLGLRDQKPSAMAVLVCLGDQPQVEERSVRSVCEAFQKNDPLLVVPSYKMRRGHPWLIGKKLWGEILNMRAPETMREFLNRHKEEILYVDCDSPTILQDLDTPDDYKKYKPG